MPLVRRRSAVARPILALALASCVASLDACGRARSGSGTDASLPALDPGRLVTRDEAITWHREKALAGPTFSGSQGWRRFSQYLEDRLREAGVVDFQRNSWTYDRWFTSDSAADSMWTLVSAGKPVRVAGYGAYSGSTDPRGLTAELVLYDSLAAPESMRGKIVVYPAPAPPDPPYSDFYLGRFTINDFEFASDSARLPPRFTRVPPDRTITLHTWWQLRSVSTGLYGILEKVGAAGGIAVFDLPPGHLDNIYTFPTQTLHKVPVLYMDRLAGRQVLDDARRHRRATLKLIATVEPTETYQLIGYLPGKDYGTSSDRRIVLVTHTDGPSISQDNGALGILGVVRYFSRLPRPDRPKTLMVFLDNRHYMPGMEPAFAEQDWFARHPGERGKVDGVIAIEHLGQVEYREVDGTIVPTGEAELTYLYARPDQAQIDLAIEAVVRYGLPKTIIQAPERRGVHGGKQGIWYGMGEFTQAWNVPGFSTLSMLGGYWSTGIGIERFDADLFVKQVSAMTALTGALMR